MRVLAIRRLRQFVDNMLWGRLIRVPHAEINDVLTPRTRFRLECIYYRKYIGRKPLDTAKLFHFRCRHSKPLDIISMKDDKLPECPEKFNHVNTEIEDS